MNISWNSDDNLRSLVVVNVLERNQFYKRNF